MKKTIQNLLLLTLLLGVLFPSCVSKKKYLRSETKIDMLRMDSTTTHNSLNDCNMQLGSLKLEKASLQNENAAVQGDLNALSVASKMTIADQAKRLRSLQDMIQAQNEVTNRLKNSIANALMNFNADELLVYIKDGNVYVSLAEKLLFKSGSAVVDPKGKEALKMLAQVLISTQDIAVLVEGHTDNIPIKTNQFKDNWDLSTARATSIVRLLTIDYGFDASRITASGKSQFHPVRSNETPEERAANRRTEIILSPDLNELYKLLY